MNEKNSRRDPEGGSPEGESLRRTSAHASGFELAVTAADGADHSGRGVKAAARVPDCLGVGQKFELHEPIGEGGMGKVFRATDRTLQRDVAIKLLFPSEALTSADMIRLCYHEARAIARMDHENIVRVYELDDKNDPPFIVMEYLRGQTLADFLRQGRLSDEEILRVMTQLSRGLGHAHKLGVLHRDLKPSNVFLLEGGQVKLLDFGLARLNAPAADAEATMPFSMPAVGTPGYMAPEQWLGDEPGTLTDMWAAFVVLFELLTGELPYIASSIVELRKKVLSEPPPSLRALRPNLPPEFLAWFERCFSKDPAARCQSAEELGASLAELAPGLRTRISSRYPIATPLPPSWDEFFTDQPTPRCLVHRAQRRSSLPVWQRALVLFLDEESHPLGSWAAVAEKTLQVAGLDVDVALHVLRPNPTDLHWLDGETEQLEELLETEFKGYRHVVVVARELGTILVKRALVGRLEALAAAGKTISKTDPLPWTYRIRQLVRASEQPTSPSSRPRMPAATSAETDAMDSREIETIERHFRRWGLHLKEALLPHSVVQQVAVQPSGAPDTERPRSSDREADPIAALAHRLAGIVSGPDVLMACESITQSFDLDRASKVKLLVENEGANADRSVPAVASARTGAQAEMFRTLLHVTQQSQRRPPCLVLTGDAGVGKSTVLRHLARKVSADYLDAPRAGTQLCFFVPLSFMALEAESIRTYEKRPLRSKGELLHDMFLDWWCTWFAGITFKGSVRREWLCERLRSEPTLVIMDGVDEFLTNHPAFGPADIRLMITFMRTAYGQNRQLCILLGVRNSQPSLFTLASEPSRVYEVQRLTDAQAEAFFPGARAWMSGITDAQLKRLILTPLLLAQVDPSGPRPALGEVTTRAEVLEQVLLTIVDQSRLSTLPRPGRGPVEPSHWVGALMLVAWRMFARLRADIAVEDLREEAREIIRSWERQLARSGHLQEAGELLSSFALVCDPLACEALLHRTVLYPSGQGEVRFLHREWQDFLTARYLAECLRYGYVDELGHFAFTLPIFLAAGERLGTLRIELDLICEVEQRTQATGEKLIHANFCAVLGNSRTPMSGPAMEMLLGDLQRMPLLSRLVTLASFGARAMKNALNDPSVGDLRNQLVLGMLSLAGDESVDALSRSLAWCNAKAFHLTFGTEAPSMPWPGLGLRPEDEDGPLEILCDRSTTPFTVSPRHRSLQLAWMQIQSMTLVTPHRPISTVHYLYTLVVMKRRGLHIQEVAQELPAVFAPGSPLALGYQNYSVVPEVWTIFQRCRDIFNSS